MPSSSQTSLVSLVLAEDTQTYKNQEVKRAHSVTFIFNKA